MRIAMMGMVLCAMATPAWAQRALETPAGGVRIELVVGWDRPVMRTQGWLSAGGQTLSAEVSGGKSGVSYGGEVGYDVATSSATFLGGYVGLAGSTAEYRLPADDIESGYLHSGRNLTVGLRAGIMSRGVAFYAKGGWSNGQIAAAYRNSDAPELDWRLSDTVDGFHIGLGLQARLPGRAYAKVEYVFTNYNGYELAVRGPGGSAGGKIDFDRHQIAGGLGVRF